jgi:NADP-dependent 3-hydroxy acid dehydrogenase YdfG
LSGDIHEEGEEVRLAGRTAVVTGASRGIGAETARRLAAAGARVALVARSRDALEELAASIGNDAVVVVADLSVESAAEDAAGAVVKEFAGSPDILVNNAGVFQVAGLTRITADEFSTSLRTNLLAPFMFVRSFLPGMLDRKSGHIVTIGSVADRAIFAGNGAYAATKFGARAMHEVLREETRGTGVRATLVSPAATDTDIWEPIRFPDGSVPQRSGMLRPSAVGNAVLFALTQPAIVNIDELRLSRS